MHLTPDDPKAAAVAREVGLRGSTRASHAFVMDVPGLKRPLVLTDCVVNIAPALMDKRDIVQNAVDFAKAIGIEVPHVAILSAVETINPAIESTLDAAALCKMADRGQTRALCWTVPWLTTTRLALRRPQIRALFRRWLDGPMCCCCPIWRRATWFTNSWCVGRVPIVRVWSRV